MDPSTVIDYSIDWWRYQSLSSSFSAYREKMSTAWCQTQTWIRDGDANHLRWNTASINRNLPTFLPFFLRARPHNCLGKNAVRLTRLVGFVRQCYKDKFEVLIRRLIRHHNLLGDSLSFERIYMKADSCIFSSILVNSEHALHNLFLLLSLLSIPFAPGLWPYHSSRRYFPVIIRLFYNIWSRFSDFLRYRWNYNDLPQSAVGSCFIKGYSHLLTNLLDAKNVSCQDAIYF